MATSEGGSMDGEGPGWRFLSAVLQALWPESRLICHLLRLGLHEEDSTVVEAHDHAFRMRGCGSKQT